MKTLTRIEPQRDIKNSGIINQGKKDTVFVQYKCLQCNRLTAPIHTCIKDGITYHADGF